MKKSREQLAADLAEANKRLEQEKHKLYRLENRKSYLESGSQKQRNHRLITRGAAVESVIPDVKFSRGKSTHPRLAELPKIRHFRQYLCRSAGGKGICMDDSTGQEHPEGRDLYRPQRS